MEGRLHIREYRPTDATAVSALIRTTMRVSNAREYSPDVLEPLIDYFSPEKVDRLNRERHCLVADEDGSVVGTAALEGSALVTFFVHPDRQGRGIGSAILEELERFALVSGLRHLRVESSVTGAPFYERRDYRRTGRVIEETAGRQIELTKRIVGS